MSRASFRLVDGGLGILTLERPDASNAIDPEMVAALDRATAAAEGQPDLRALLIRADGPAFSVGGDLKYLGAHADNLSDELEPMVGLYHETLKRLAVLPVPVVCAARGAVAGGALGLLCVADIAIVAEDVKLATGFLDLGLSADGGSSWWLPRLVGLQRARELMLHRRIITGAEAVEWGLVSRAVPAAEVESDAERVARMLAGHTVKAYAEIRALLAASFERNLAEGLRAEQEAMLRTAVEKAAHQRIERFTIRSDEAV
jgi:2-(1,2-epoxy-1,2-dihydrophenyl)acetyl-CoA isomerase